MNKAKKLIALLLVLVMTVNLFATLGLVSTQAADGETTVATDFTETFSGSMSSKWENDAAGHVFGGLFHADRFLVNRYFGAQNTKDYYVQADVTYNRYFNGEENHTGFTGIAARYDESADSGYELAVGAVPQNDNLVVRFAKRVNGSITGNYTVLGTVGKVGDKVSLRISVYGNTVLCYVNNVLMHEVEDSTFAAGVPAMVNGDAQGTYDNFVYSTFAPTGYDYTQTISFAGDANRVFKNSAEWDPNFTMQGSLYIEKPHKTSEDIYGNEIEVDDSYWDDPDATQPTVTGTPVYGGVLGATAAAQVTVQIRGDLQAQFLLDGSKQVTLTVLKGETRLYTENLGANKAFALQFVSADEQVEILVDGASKYTYQGALSGDTRVITENAVGKLSGISFTTADIAKSIEALDSVIVKQGTAPADIAGFDLTYTSLLGETAQVRPQQVIGYSADSPIGEHQAQLVYKGLAANCKVIVVDDPSLYAYDTFASASDIWGTDVTNHILGGKLVLDDLGSTQLVGSEDWVDYTVQADLQFNGHITDGASTQFTGIYARKDADGNGIELALLSSADSNEAMYGRLYFRGAGHSDSEYVTPVSYTKDHEYNLRLDVYGQEVKAYINGELLFHEYIPNVSATLFTSGAVGIKSNGKSTVDRFQAGKITAEDFGAEALGTPDTATAAFISAVTAKTRRSATIATVEPLVEQFATLSLEQKATIPGYVINKYNDMLLRAQRVAYPEVADADLLFMDDFDDSSQWNLSQNGKYYIENGKMQFYATSDLVNLDEYMEVLSQEDKDIPGRATYLSAEFTVNEIDMKEVVTGTTTDAEGNVVNTTELQVQRGAYPGLYACNSEEGYYHLRLYIGGNAKVLQLYRFVGGHGGGQQLASAAVESATTVLPTDTFKLTMTVTDTHIYGYYNDVQYISYTRDATDDKMLNTESHSGFRMLYCNANIDNFMIMGTPSERVEDVLTDEGYAEAQGTYTAGTYFRDGFDGESVGAKPGSWLQNNYANNWSVQKESTLTDTVVFSEDFSTTPSWLKKGSVQNGAMLSGVGTTDTFTVNATNMPEFSIEADVALHYGESTSNMITGALCYKNYEFGLTKERSTGNSGYRLYDRNTDPVATEKNGKTTAYGQVTNGSYDFDWDDILHLTFTLKGGIFSGYINGECVFSVADPQHYSGTSKNVILRTSTYTATFDNIKITVPPTAAAGTNNVYVYRPKNGQHTQSWLHVFDTAPIMSARVKVANLMQGAQVGVITRYAVENSYVKAGYDFDAQKWFISYTPGVEYETKTVYAGSTLPFNTDTWYTLDLVTTGTNVYFSVNGELMASQVVDYVGYGRVSLVAQNLTAAFDDVYSYSPMAATYDSGIVEQALWDDQGNCGELEILEEVVNGQKVILATRNGKLLASYDSGVTFTDKHDYTLPSTPLGYVSTVKTYDANGVFQNYVAVGYQYQAFTSTDFKTWTGQDYIIEPTKIETAEDGTVSTYYYEEYTDSILTYKEFKEHALDHISSFGLIDIGTDTPRLMIPVGIRYLNDATDAIQGHYTRVFYSDDYGVTWNESVNNTRDITAYENATLNSASFCEAKFVGTGTQTVYMYCTRKWAPYVHYLRSLDGGVTWDPTFFGVQDGSGATGYAMPCATSSFGVAEDPLNPGTWYMVYVKDVPYTPTSIWPRNHFVLAKTTNGVDWEEIMTLDRYTSTPHPLSAELYQFLDPNILVTEDYIYATYGRSDKYKEGTHNHQYARYYRIDRWNSVSVDSDMQGILSVNTDRANRGDTVTVTVTQPADAQIKAGSLKVYSVDRSNSMKVITQPSQVLAGTGLGNTFEFTMPAADVVIDAELIENLSTADTNFSVAVLAASYKSNVTDTKDGLRYLSRMYLPQDGKGNLLLDVTYGGKQYTIVGFGSLYAKTATLGTTTLDMAAVKSGVAKVSEAYPGGKLYDINAGFVDFTVRLVGATAQLQEAYSVRTYVELQDADGNTAYAYSDDTISRSYANFH